MGRMGETTGKRVARVKLTLSKRNIDNLEAANKPWIAWDDKLTGFGMKVYPSGKKSFVVNYRSGEGSRKDRNNRVVIGHYGRISAEEGRRRAHKLLGEVASGGDPAEERAEARRMPLLSEAFEDYMAVNPNRKARTNEDYRKVFRRYLSDWGKRALDAITRQDVEARFNSLTVESGWASANQAISLLRSVYRRPCVDIEGLRSPVDLWLAGGGKFHRNVRRKISSPAEVLPRWRMGIEATVENPVMRDTLWFGVYTGMRLNEVLPLRWESVDRDGWVFRVDETKTGVPLELPITRQVGAVLDRRWAENGDQQGGWVFPSRRSGTGHIIGVNNYYAAIGKAGGAKFWYHALRNCFITIAERDLMIAHTLTKRLVNHVPPRDVTEGYAADWTIDQLREPAQRIADRIEILMGKGL